MIVWVDEAQHLAEYGELLPEDSAVHVIFNTGLYPMCWQHGETGAFIAGTEPEEITCLACQMMLEFCADPLCYTCMDCRGPCVMI